MVFACIPTISPSIQKLDVPLLMKLVQPREVTVGLKSPRSLARRFPSIAIQTKYKMPGEMRDGRGDGWLCVCAPVRQEMSDIFASLAWIVLLLLCISIFHEPQFLIDKYVVHVWFILISLSKDCNCWFMCIFKHKSNNLDKMFSVDSCAHSDSDVIFNFI